MTASVFSNCHLYFLHPVLSILNAISLADNLRTRHFPEGRYGLVDGEKLITQAKMQKSWSKLGRTGIVPGGDGVPPYNHCFF
ncbi:hypothetical protein ABNY11_004201 [Enterobacter roggenkampii]